MKKLLTLTILFPLFLSTISSQKLDHVLGDVIVQAKPNAGLYALERRLQTFQEVKTGLKVSREISNPWRTWLLSFDYTKVNENIFLSEINRQPEVEVAQFNHLISLRDTVPNDPSFGMQWQWVNTGQSGGTADADVDADQAWSITTGGKTATGKDIVVCVVEGANRNHPDLQGNLWFNEAEIPNNGLDDDGNGYVDDYRGWNPVDGNDNIPPDGHGTTVSGMIGAKGNNNLIVTGINWDVKIMHVEVGFLTEANVIASYTYPFIMRKRYNESGGTSGAFVVATNSSWGIDNANPNNFPLWCAFYDSLGSVGILSCGATANNNVNIDVVGDMPTGCTSEYLVSVTATNHNDVRTFTVGAPAYGLTGVDVAAPGANIVSINQSNGTTNTSGTSFASPLTAGIIGLLYSAPCSGLGILAIEDPAGTALAVRDYLFNGVDPKPNLQNEIKYGGRVNAYNSLLLLLEECPRCLPPSLVRIEEVLVDSAGIAWVSSDSTITTNLRWRIAGTGTWTVENNVVSPFTFDNLQACTEYEFQLEDICTDTTSGFTSSFFFKTDGCCEPPHVAVSNIGETSALASWNFLTAANSYNLLLTTPQGSQLISGLTDTLLLLDGLEPCMVYGVQLQTVCDTGVTAFGQMLEFTTLGCGACLDLPYCEAKGENADEDWIANVTLNTLNNTSGSDGGYGDFTGLGTELFTYNIYPVSITPGYAANPNKMWFVVWIDFNQDGDFDDAGEDFFIAEDATTTVTGNLIIPPGALPGPTRMRVIMRYEFEPGPCEFDFNFGEVEDYCVTIMEGTLPDCIIPDGLSAANLTFTGVTLQWNSQANAVGYGVRFRKTGAATWTVVSASGTSVTLQNLMACTGYEFQARSVCIGTESDWSASQTFTTECYPPCDEIPSGLDTSGVSETAVLLHWTAAANAEAYRIRYKKTVNPDWQTAQTSQLSYNLTALTKCTPYQFTVQALCPGNLESDFAGIFDFETDCVGASGEAPENVESLSVRPNPFNSTLWLEFSLLRPAEATIELIDARGQRLYRSTGLFSAGPQQFQLHEAAGILPAGIYFVKMTVDGGYVVRKVVRE